MDGIESANQGVAQTFQLRARNGRSKNRVHAQTRRVYSDMAPSSPSAQAPKAEGTLQSADRKEDNRVGFHLRRNRRNRPSLLSQVQDERAEDRSRSTLSHEHQPVQRSLKEEMRLVFRHLPQSPVIVTTKDPSDPKKPYRGATVSSFTSVSVEPEIIISMNFQLPSATFDAIERSGKFEIKLLKATDQAAELAKQFSRGHSRSPFKFLSPDEMPQESQSGNAIDPPTVHPVLATTLSTESPIVNTISCTYLPKQTVRICDHAVIFGHITTAPTTSPDSIGENVSCLAYHARRYGKILPFKRRESHRPMRPRESTDIRYHIMNTKRPHKDARSQSRSAPPSKKNPPTPSGLGSETPEDRPGPGLESETPPLSYNPSTSIRRLKSGPQNAWTEENMTLEHFANQPCRRTETVSELGSGSRSQLEPEPAPLSPTADLDAEPNTKPTPEELSTRPPKTLETKSAKAFLAGSARKARKEDDPGARKLVVDPDEAVRKDIDEIFKNAVQGLEKKSVAAR